MTFFINEIKLTTIYARRVGFFLLSCRGLFISFFCFLFKFREQDGCALAFGDLHPSPGQAGGIWEQTCVGGREGGEAARAPEGAGPGSCLRFRLGGCCSIVLPVVISSL